MAVFVLDKRKKPLMPCSEKRARKLLEARRAVVHRLQPFTIRLKDRTQEESVLQPVVLKIDPGSKTTGMAVVRGKEGDEGRVHHALQLSEITHRGGTVRKRMAQRAAYRRRRRSANLRYRAPRFNNRRRPAGWLPPSLRSRVDSVLMDEFARIEGELRVHVNTAESFNAMLKRGIVGASTTSARSTCTATPPSLAFRWNERAGDVLDNRSMLD